MPRHDPWLSILVADPSVLTRKRRHLLCRPAGGLTDMLSQISICMAYARHHDRCLIIDTDIRDFVAESASDHFFDSHQLRAPPTEPKPSQPSQQPEFCSQVDPRPDEPLQRSAGPLGPKGVISQTLGHFTNLRDVESSAPLSSNFRVPYPKESSQDIRQSG
jgi:hypothetical protein